MTSLQLSTWSWAAIGVMAHTTDGPQAIIPGTRDGMIPGIPGIPGILGIPGIHLSITAGIVPMAIGAGLILPGTGDIITGIGVVVITTAGMTGHGMAITATPVTLVPPDPTMTATGFQMDIVQALPLIAIPVPV